jgi:hypothetical protein
MLPTCGSLANHIIYMVILLCSMISCNQTCCIHGINFAIYIYKISFLKQRKKGWNVDSKQPYTKPKQNLAKKQEWTIKGFKCRDLSM